MMCGKVCSIGNFSDGEINEQSDTQLMDVVKVIKLQNLECFFGTQVLVQVQMALADIFVSFVF